MNLSHLNDKTPLDAALYYAKELGWPVFPIWNPIGTDKCACGNPDCTQIGKHPVGSLVPNGVKNATINTDTIKTWWTTKPSANIAVATGRGLCVIDVDARNGGIENFAKLPNIDPNLPRSLSSSTGGGGKHYYVRVPNEYGNLGNPKPWKGIDVKSDGGYVLTPPSLHISGRKYQWDDTNTNLEEMSVALVREILSYKGDKTFVEKALSSELPIPEGCRNDTLYSLSASYRAYGRPYDMAVHDLRLINLRRCAPPLHDEDVVGIVQRAYQKPPSFLYNDLGNAEMLRHYFGDNVIWTTEAGWLVWDEGKWQQRTEEEMHSFCHTYTKGLYHSAKEQGEDGKALLRHAERSMMTGRLSAMAREWRTLQVGSYLIFDQRQMLLPCLNGTYDLTNKVFRDARKDDYMLNRIPVNYDPHAVCPNWMDALGIWTDNDEELITALQRLTGYFLTGDVRHHAFFILHGPGGTGKSTFTQTIQMLLGGYSISVATDMLMERPSINRETEIIRLYGKRLAVCAESGKTDRINVETLKMLTGGDLIRGRNLYEKAINFKPSHKFIFFTNDLPRLPPGDSGIWRRIKIIPFRRVITKEELRPMLLTDLAKELPGILNWALEGCRDWQERGDLSIANKMEKETEVYKKSQDRIGQFLDEMCTEDPKGKVNGKDLYVAYTNWCSDGGYHGLGRNNFFRELEDRPYLRRSMDGTSPVFAGVRLRNYRHIVASSQ